VGNDPGQTQGDIKWSNNLHSVEKEEGDNRKGKWNGADVAMVNTTSESPFT
jgi:hypothetical protein